MTETTLAPVKVKHRAMWALGDYPAVAADVIPSLGPVLVEACAITAADRVLDVAAGSGNAAVPAARTGAPSWPSDLTPELLDRGRELASRGGLDLRLGGGRRRGPAVRRRLVRRGDLLRGRDVRAVPPGRGRRAGPGHPARRADRADQLDAGGLHRPDVRGDEAVRSRRRRPARSRLRSGATRTHVRALLGDRVGDVVAQQADLKVDCFATRGRVPGLLQAHVRPDDRGLPGHRRRPRQGRGPRRGPRRPRPRYDLGGGAMEWEYLLVTARRA